ncbi:hypothetical protein A2U01_0056041, partial [Trifolium medium]|nr:hypothetical protein [Trifolium medium]
TRKMAEKMIQEVPLEEIGGKDLSIIKRAHTCQGKYAPQGK